MFLAGPVFMSFEVCVTIFHVVWVCLHSCFLFFFWYGKRKAWFLNRVTHFYHHTALKNLFKQLIMVILYSRCSCHISFLWLDGNLFDNITVTNASLRLQSWFRGNAAEVLGCELNFRTDYFKWMKLQRSRTCFCAIISSVKYVGVHI